MLNSKAGFWNNNHQIRPKSIYWKAEYFEEEKMGAKKPKELNMIAKTGYGHMENLKLLSTL